jgi:RNA recognition motif-containing protein
MPVFAGKPARSEFVEMKKIYVGNLPFTATEDEVRDLFGAHGEVHSVALINDRDTGRPRGFGFVEMDDAPAAAAIAAINGTSMGGRDLNVNEARERPRRDNRGSGW